VLLCTVLPGPLRIALAIGAWRGAWRLAPAGGFHGRSILLCGDGVGGWWLAGAPQRGGLRLRRAVRLPILGWLLEFAGERGPLWLRVPPRSLDRRGGRLLSQLATAGRT
jgi:hypothetical protein